MAKESWSRVLYGIAEVCAGLGDALLSDAPEDTTATVNVQTSTNAPKKDFVVDLLKSLAKQVADKTAPREPIDPEYGEVGMPDASDPLTHPGQFESPLVDEDVTVPAPPPVPLQECPELDRQRKEQRRRQAFIDDPVSAMSAAAYWLLHLQEQPSRAEDWARCIEALPGSPQERIAAVINMGISNVQLYATYYDECISALKQGIERAAKMRDFVDRQDDKSEMIDTTQLLDIDQQGRILFWLGDRPDVEAITGVAAPTGDVQTAAPAGEAPLLTLEELEAMQPSPDGGLSITPMVTPEASD